MPPHRNWDSPNPSPANECALPPRTKGWGGTVPPHAHSPAAKRVGKSQYRRLEKKLSTLPTLWLREKEGSHNRCVSWRGEWWGRGESNSNDKKVWSFYHSFHIEERFWVELFLILIYLYHQVNFTLRVRTTFKHTFTGAVTYNAGFCNGCITKRCLYNSRNMS